MLPLSEEIGLPPIVKHKAGVRPRTDALATVGQTALKRAKSEADVEIGEDRASASLRLEFHQLVVQLKNVMEKELPELLSQRKADLQIKSALALEADSAQNLKRMLELHQSWRASSLGERQHFAVLSRLDSLLAEHANTFTLDDQQSCEALRRQLQRLLGEQRLLYVQLSTLMQSCMQDMPSAQERLMHSLAMKRANKMLMQLSMLFAEDPGASAFELSYCADCVRKLRAERAALEGELAPVKLPSFLTKRFEMIDANLAALEKKWGPWYQLVDAIHYHPNCSSQRAQRLLGLQPQGTYLVRKENDGFVLCWHSPEGVKQKWVKQPSQNFQQALQKQLCTEFPKPLADAPQGALAAAFEFNASSSCAPELLSKCATGSCSITRRAENYVIHYVDASGLRSLETSIVDGAVQVEGQGRFTSLYDALEYLVPGYVLVRDQPNCILEDVYYQHLLPVMRRLDLSWARISKKLDPGLRASVWIGRDGQLYQRLPKFEHFRVGAGGTKTWWELRPLYSAAPQPRMLRGSFEFSDERVAEIARQSALKMEDLKKDFPNDPRFLLPVTVAHPRKGDMQLGMRRSQLAPKLAGACDMVWSQLSPIGRLRALAQMVDIQLSLVRKGWYYLDYKPENFLVRELLDPDAPELCLSDFDFLRRISRNGCVQVGTALYMDPRMMRRECTSAYSVAVAEQFCFGMSMFELLVGELPRRTDEEVLAGKTLGLDLLAKSGAAWNLLDPALKEVIATCIVGERRSYQMAEISEVLGQQVICAQAHRLLDKL